MKIIRSMIMVGCALSLMGCAKRDTSNDPLMVHVGGTMRRVFEELAKTYEKETGQKVEINSAGSGELLANIEMQAEGDLYVCHDPFLDIIMDRKLAIDGWTVAEIYPVIIVQEGNPKNIKTLKDLTRPDVQLALTDYKLSTLGRMLPTIFSKAGIDIHQVTKEKNITIHRSGSYIANLVSMKNADAALVWEAVSVLRKDEVDSIPITKYLPVRWVDTVTSATGKDYKLTPIRVTICSLKCSDQMEAGQKFIEFSTSERVRDILEEFGFGVPEDLRRQEFKNGEKL